MYYTIMQECYQNTLDTYQVRHGLGIMMAAQFHSFLTMSIYVNNISRNAVRANTILKYEFSLICFSLLAARYRFGKTYGNTTREVPACTDPQGYATGKYITFPMM